MCRAPQPQLLLSQVLPERQQACAVRERDGTIAILLSCSPVACIQASWLSKSTGSIAEQVKTCVVSCKRAVPASPPVHEAGGLHRHPFPTRIPRLSCYSLLSKWAADSGLRFRINAFLAHDRRQQRSAGILWATMVGLTVAGSLLLLLSW